MRRSLETLSIERSNSQLAALQFTLTQQLNLQPEVLPAEPPLAGQQQQLGLSSCLSGTQQPQLQSDVKQQHQGLPAEAPASINEDCAEVQERGQPGRGDAAASSTSGSSKQALHGSVPLQYSTAAMVGPAAASAAVTRMRSSDGGGCCGPEVQAAAQSLRRSFDRQASRDVAAASAAAQASAAFQRHGSFNAFRAAAGAATPSLRCANSLLERQQLNNMANNQHCQQTSSVLGPGLASSPSVQQGSCSGSSDQHPASGVLHANDTLPPPYLRSNSGSTGPRQLQAVDDEHAAQRLRLMDMCDNHAMFQFLFDAQGQLLAANKRAMNNMRGKQACMPSHMQVHAERLRGTRCSYCLQ
jgi:hypothetical protein